MWLDFEEVQQSTIHQQLTHCLMRPTVRGVQLDALLCHYGMETNTCVLLQRQTRPKKAVNLYLRSNFFPFSRAEDKPETIKEIKKKNETYLSLGASTEMQKPFLTLE